MKKRTALIGAILSLIPLGQPLLIKTGVVLSSTAVMLSLPEKALAESAVFYYNRGNDKSDAGDYYGAISDYTKAIEMNPKDVHADYNIALYNEDIGEGRTYLGQWEKPKANEEEASRKRRWTGIGTIKYPDGAVY